jgi:pimeloyl-ACP methyl ester carboxylesterase
VGYYYPAKYAQAPVVILMHWAGGDQRDYCLLAPWLQNRLDEAPAEMPGCAEAPAAFTWGGPTSWWDPTWFPPLPVEASLAVLTFDFRDFGESEAGMGSRGEWAQDALVAFQTAANLEGVDNTRMVAAGASIGADGAADGCLLYNQTAGSGCLGGFSISPGNYLEMPYPEVVTSLDTADPSIPAWCLAGEYDTASFEACNAAAGDSYRSQVYLGREEHGMKLVDPRFEPTVLDLLLAFLALTLEL